MVAQTVTVGRIDDEKPGLGRNLALAKHDCGKTNIILHVRALGIAASGVHGARVPIHRKNRGGRARQSHRRVAQCLPRRGIVDRPAFEGKGARQAGRHLARHGCGLDGDGARAAHGIHERQRGIVLTQGQKARCQGFAQGGAPCFQTPAAAV